MLRCLLWVTLCLLDLAQICRAGPVELLDRKIPNFEVRDQPMLLAVDQLRKAGVRICFEEVELDPIRDRTVDALSGAVRINKTRLSTKLEKAAIREILDELVRIDRDYAWHADPLNQLVEIVPREVVASGAKTKSVLDWEVSLPEEVRGKRMDILVNRLALDQHGVHLFWRGPYGEFNPDVALEHQKGPARSILNELVSFAPKLCWTLAGFKGSRILTLVACEE